jgi:hypothetical protein
VREAIERDGVVKHGLARGLINVRALARSIQVATPGETSFDAILSAIRRYPIKQSSAKRASIGKMILKLSLKNRIVVVSIRNQPELQLMIARFAGEVNYARGDSFRVVSGVESVSVTIDSKNLNKLDSKIPKQAVLRKLGNLAEIVVDMASEDMPGVISAITAELAMNDVSIVQLSTVGPGRIIILTNERDAMKAYQSLEEMSKAT